VAWEERIIVPVGTLDALIDRCARASRVDEALARAARRTRELPHRVPNYGRVY
jgi:hypothetical protein